MTPAFFVENQMGKWWYLILPIIVCLISCCDLLATLYFEKTNCYFQEANPIAVYVWTTYGDYGLVGFKITITLVSCVCMAAVLHGKNRCWRIVVSIFGLSICIFLVGWWIFWEQLCVLNV
jgi:hypothetical protein